MSSSDSNSFWIPFTKFYTPFQNKSTWNFFIWHNDNWGKQWTDSLRDCEKLRSVSGLESLYHLRTLTLNEHWQAEFLRWLRCNMQKYVMCTHTYITYKNVLLYKQGHDSYKFNLSELSWLTKTGLSYNSPSGYDYGLELREVRKQNSSQQLWGSHPTV